MVYQLFDKKFRDTDIYVSTNCGARKSGNIKIMPNKQLLNQLKHPITRKLKKHKVYSFLRDDIYGTGLAHMQTVSKFNGGIIYIYHVLLVAFVNLHKFFLWKIKKMSLVVIQAKHGRKR